MNPEGHELEIPRHVYSEIRGPARVFSAFFSTREYTCLTSEGATRLGRSGPSLTPYLDTNSSFATLTGDPPDQAASIRRLEP
jgi:hypothetical protein